MLSTIGYGAFWGSKLVSIEIPASVTYIESNAFNNSTSLETIKFKGTISEWNSVSIGDEDVFKNVPATKVICTDGEVTLPKN